MGAFDGGKKQLCDINALCVPVSSANMSLMLVCVSLRTLAYSSNVSVIRSPLVARKRSALRVSPDLMLLLPVERETVSSDIKCPLLFHFPSFFFIKRKHNCYGN